MINHPFIITVAPQIQEWNCTRFLFYLDNDDSDSIDCLVLHQNLMVCGNGNSPTKTSVPVSPPPPKIQFLPSEELAKIAQIVLRRDVNLMLHFENSYPTTKENAIKVWPTFVKKSHSRGRPVNIWLSINTQENVPIKTIIEQYHRALLDWTSKLLFPLCFFPHFWIDECLSVD